jgi:hypothetical protein
MLTVKKIETPTWRVGDRSFDKESDALRHVVVDYVKNLMRNEAMEDADDAALIIAENAHDMKRALNAYTDALDRERNARAVEVEL